MLLKTDNGVRMQTRGKHPTLGAYLIAIGRLEQNADVYVDEVTEGDKDELINVIELSLTL